MGSYQCHRLEAPLHESYVNYQPEIYHTRLFSAYDFLDMIYVCGKENKAEKRPTNIDECSVLSPLLKERLD
jgi:hypothetical protein